MSSIDDRLLGGHWRLAIGGATAVAAALIAAVLVSTNTTPPGDEQTQAVQGSEIPSSVEPTPAMPPILVAANHCLSACTGLTITRANTGDAKLPYKFADLLKKPAFRSAFDALVANWPPELAGLAHLRVGDRNDLPMEGSAGMVMTTATGRTIQIYDHVGYPKNWANMKERRGPGLLDIAVDIQTGEVAGVFNGPETLSDYRFGGPDDLVAALLAYSVADEFHSEKMRELGFPKNGPQLALPLSGEGLANASARIDYFAGYFQNGMIIGTETLSGILEAKAEAAGEYWFTPNSSFTKCHKSSGPSAILDDLAGHTDRPSTKDFVDANGNLTKVEVINPDGYGNETVWTYYKRRSDCEREQVNRTSDLADQYR